MGKRHPENFDFPMSETYRDYTSDTKLVPGLKPKKPKTIIVAGITLHNIPPGTPIDETNAPKLEENLEKMGIQQTDFLNMVPLSRSSEPKKIRPPSTQPDDQQFMQIMTTLDKRRRAQGSDATREAAAEIERRRIQYGLPGKSQFTQKEMLQPLTNEQLTRLENMGFANARDIRHNTWAFEKMLMALYNRK